MSRAANPLQMMKSPEATVSANNSFQPKPNAVPINIPKISLEDLKARSNAAMKGGLRGGGGKKPQSVVVLVQPAER